MQLFLMFQLSVVYQFLISFIILPLHALFFLISFQHVQDQKYNTPNIHTTILEIHLTNYLSMTIYMVE